MGTSNFDYSDRSTLFAGGDTDDDLDHDTPPSPEDRGDLAEPESAPEPAPEPEPKGEEPAPEPEPDPKGEEPAPEPEPEPEPKGEEPAPEPKSEDPVDDNGLRIPKWRLDQEVAKRRRMEAEQSELRRRLRQFEETPQQQQQQQQQQQPQAEPEPEVDFTALDKQYHEAVLDGDTDKAAQVRQEIREAEREQWMREARQSAQQEASQVTEQDRVRTELAQEAEKIIVDYPILDQSAEGHDPDMLAEAVALRDFYMQQGHEPRYALREAADTVTLKYGYTPPQAAAAKKQPTPEPEPDTTVADSLERKQQMAGRQPPQTGGSRNDATLNVDDLPEEEFDKLSDADLARARGDLIE